VTRRPASRRPPQLADPVRARSPAPPREPTTRELLKRAHVSGRSLRFGREETLAVMHKVVEGEKRTRLGLPPFPGITMAQVEDAVTATYGWKGDGPRARIAAARTVDAFVSAADRVVEVARGGGAIAFATSRPASLLVVHRALAAAAEAAGAQVLDHTESALVGSRRRRIWWLDQVAVVTDHESLLGDAGPDLADELLFTLPHPDLVVADRVFAGRALATGHEVVAFADLDALVLAVASWRGLSVRVVPLDERRPPSAYQPLVDLVGVAPTPLAAPDLELVPDSHGLASPDDRLD
jgi:hypothetical protein